jgi:hypothetical protein
VLDLNELDTDDIPGVNREKGNDLAKAGAVCLESQGHIPSAILTVRGYSDNSYTLAWSPATAQDRRSWADTSEATENGAAGLAILLTIREIGYTVIMRSQIGTGFDYWLGDRDRLNVSTAQIEQTERLRILLQDDGLIIKGRMEVSGIRRGDDRTVRERATRRLRQTDPSDESELPAYVVVIEFGRPLAEVTQK